MKTKPMNHQKVALKRLEGRESYALFMEQGTGKTWVLLADAERLYAEGRIEGLFVVAPKGVHTNWVNREIPTHMTGNIVARAWRKGSAKAQRQVEDLFKPREEGSTIPLRVFSINYEALLTKDGWEAARRFLHCVRGVMGVVDESQRIKNPTAKRTLQLMRLRPLMNYARIASGTPINQSPVDAFSQMEFLESGLLGTTSYRAFVAEYSELLPPTSKLIIEIAKRNPKAMHAQIVAKDSHGRPKWRNIDKLQALLAPHSYRVLKRDCLDLPEKIYKVHPFELTQRQRAIYDRLHKELRIVIEDVDHPVQRLAAIMKLQQLTSGFVMPPGQPGAEPVYVVEKNARLEAFVDLLDDVDGQFIVWARFREELAAIERALSKLKITSVSYHGGVSAAAREVAVDDFQSGRARVFIGQAQAGGAGLTLTAAETVIYYSNDFNRETRAQSEDRAHRIGTKSNVLYIDLVAEGTIDEHIAEALQSKSDLAAEILGDARPRKERIIP
jgi:SNF2 family DNA or RNA helicase